MNVDWRNPVDSVDVDNDGSVSPLDALVVINYINAGEPGSLPNVRNPNKPYYDADGDQKVSPLDVLVVVNHLNREGAGQRSLFEQAGQISNETSLTLTLGQTVGSRSYRVQLDTSFDTSDPSAAFEDLLAVYLVDPLLPGTTLLDRGTPGTSLFTLAGSRAEFEPGRVRWDGSVLQIDLSDVSSLKTGLLKFQLLSSDSDNGTRVTIKPLTNEVDADTSSAPTLPLNSVVMNAGPSLDTSSLLLTADVNVQIENVRFESATGKYRAVVRLRNDGSSLGRKMVVAFPGLPAGVNLRNRSGSNAQGVPYLNFEPAIERGGLLEGKWSAPVALEFDDPGQVLFALKPQVYASTNRAPTLAPIGLFNVIPGGVLRVSLTASDPDLDPVTFSLISAAGATVSGTLESNGTLVFRPTPAQLGTYQFEVKASDGALSTSQSFTLNVLADPITTTRVSGKVLAVDRSPLANMTIEIGSVRGLTQSDGSFMLDLGNGAVVSDTLKIRGELFTGSSAYPFIAEKLPLMLEHDVYASVNNVIDRPIYLPTIDLANGKMINPLQTTTVTTAALPGAKVVVGAGTLMNQQGTPFTGLLSITDVPVTLTPAALPAGLIPDLVVTIQPGEMSFTTPTPLSLPNAGGFAPGTLLDLWSINPVTGQFDKVGLGKVSSDGSVIDTISGGIRNSSWHFFSPPAPTGPKNKNDPRNKGPNDPCNMPKSEATSSCELHSGALIETHDLVTYQSQGINRGLTLTYDSMRADPRPIVHFTFSDLNPNLYSVPSAVRLVAELDVGRNGFSRQTPGLIGNAYGFNGNENIWRLPAEAGSVDAALQVDLRDQPSGVYDYTLRSGMLGYAGQRGFIGTLNSTTGQVTSVNNIGSALGSGWGISGLYELVENPDGSVLVINGDGSELLFPRNATGGYIHPPGVFATLSKLPNGTFQRLWLDKTVEQYNAINKLATITDRNGNLTRYEYDNVGRIQKITDPVGLATTFAYSLSRVEISDPVARLTRLDLDAQGNLTRVTDPDGSSRRWRYDAQHRMVGETDQLGNVETANYGFHGRVTDVVRKDGSTRRFLPLDIQGLFPPEQTAADPIATLLSNPMAGRVPAPEAVFADSNSNVTRSTIDVRGQISSSRDSVGALTNVLRNNENLPVQIVDGVQHTNWFSYDSNGNVLTQSEDLSEDQSNGQRPFGTALKFDGVDDHVVIADAPSLRPTNLTLEGWVKFDADRSATILSKLMANGNNGYSDNLISYQISYQSGQLVSTMSNGSRFDYISIPWKPVIGLWYHLALTFDDTTDTQTIYVNGVPVSIGMVTLSIAYAEHPFLIGAGLSRNVTFPGAIDEVRIWNVARTGDQIRAEMFRIPSANEVGLIASYSFEESSNANVLDNSGNGNHGAFTSTPFYVNSGIENPQAAVQPPSGLVGWWSADGNANDLAAGNNGEIRDRTSFYPGVVGLGFLFSGQGADRVRIADAADGSLDVTGDITINAWINPITPYSGYPTTPRTIVQKQSLSVNGIISYGLFLEADGRLSFTSQQAGGAIGRVSANASIPEKKWSHIAVTISDNTLQFYVDGARLSAVQYPFPRPATDGPMTIGATPVNRSWGEDTVDQFPGGIDEVQLFNRALTSQEIRLIARAGRAGQSKPTVFDAASDFSLAGNPNGTWEYGYSTSPGADFTRLTSKISEDTNIIGLAETNIVYRTRTRITDGFGKFIAAGDYLSSQSKADSLTLRVGSDGRNSVVRWTAPQAGKYRINGRFEGVFESNSNSNDVNVLLNNNIAAPLVSGFTQGFRSQVPFSVSRVLSAGDRLEFTAGPRGRNTFNYVGLSATIVLENSAANGNGPGAGDDVATTTYTYEPNFNQMTSVTDEVGRKTLYTIDPANGNTLGVTNVVGTQGGNDDRVTSSTYTATGQIDTITNDLGQVTQFEYDLLGRVIKTRNAAGTAKEVSQQYQYDAAGRATAITDENGNRTRFDFDVMNRVTKVTQADGSVSSFAYDLRGNQRSSTNALGNTQSQTYDSLDRPVRQTDAAGNVTRYAYDIAGNLSSVTDPLNQVVRYQYDARRRTVSESDAANNVTRFKYDVVDRLSSLQDARGNKTSYVYDSLGRLTKSTDPLGKSTTYKFDKADQLLEMTDRTGRVTKFRYNELGELVSENWLNADLSTANAIQYTYDAIGQLAQANDGFSSMVYTRDLLNRVTREQMAGPNGIPTTFLDSTYDSVGNRLTLHDTINSVVGATNTWAYDSRNRVKQLIQTGPGIALKRVDFGRNALGQMTAISRFADAAGQVPVAATAYTYDTLQRPTSITHRSAASVVINSFSYQYDTGSRITRITDIDGATNYTYDSRDQLIGANHADVSNPDETYAYDATGNRTASSLHGVGYKTGVGNRLDSDGTYNYSYDHVGNMVRRVTIVSGAFREFAYDHRNRLVQVSDRPGAAGATTQIVKYTYDLMNRRIAMNVDKTPTDAIDGVITYFVYDGQDVIADLIDSDGSGPDSAVKSMRYLHGPAVDQVLAQESSNGDVEGMLTDHLGTVRDLISSSDQMVNHIKYDSYGNVISESNPALKTRYKYSGREFDAETELQYNRARYYDAAIGRFISEDPIGFAGGDANIYRYVSNIPIDSTDPNGLKKREQGEPVWKKINNAITWGKGVYNSGKEKITNAFDWIDWTQDRYDDFQNIRNEQAFSDFQRERSDELLDQWVEKSNEGTCENPNDMRFKRGIRAVQPITEQIQRKLEEFADNSLFGKLFAKMK